MKDIKFRKDYVISASEIAQYHFCPMAWYLQRCGFEPASECLTFGKDKHVELGRVIHSTEKIIKGSRILAIIGYLLLVAAVLLLIYEVIM